MFLADTLSRVHQTVVRPKSHEEFYQVNIAQYLPISETRLRNIKDAKEHDEIIKVMNRAILQGSLGEKHDLHTSLKPCFNFPEEFKTQNGLIFKGSRVSEHFPAADERYTPFIAHGD